MALSTTKAEADWLKRFHDGEPRVLEACYREHFAVVDRAVGAVLAGADRETVVHEVFFRLITEAGVRRAFRGGSLGGWLRTMARNRAIDHLRRARREQACAPERLADLGERGCSGPEEKLHAQLVVQKFRNEQLPAQWRPVFDAVFLRRLSQREAAAELGMRRSTLAYQEQRIRTLLRSFVLEGELPAIGGGTAEAPAVDPGGTRHTSVTSPARALPLPAAVDSPVPSGPEGVR